MPAPIEDYALLSSCRTAALVSRDGSIDWLCVPRFDSPSVLGALLGDEDHGCWSLRPTDPGAVATRRYDGDTFVLVTTWRCATGVAEVHDFMPIDGHRVDVVRRIVGVSGAVEFQDELRVRLDYARALPWMRKVAAETPTMLAVAGPDALVLRGLARDAADHAHVGRIVVAAGDTADLSLTWFKSHHDVPAPLDVDASFEATRAWWQEWADRIDHHGPHHAAVVRSLLLLRALTHESTGGIVAAATTSLPEEFGGSRNWDYRYVWLRDAAWTLETLLEHGFTRTAERWRAWLLRAIAGDPADVQIMYGAAGERELSERVLDSLPGYLGAAPVRVGNGAVSQYQADVIGEVLVALEATRAAGITEDAFSWPLQRALLGQMLQWRDRPDRGIWEIRAEERMFTHSRAMVWAALDRGVRAVRESGLDGDADAWERARDEIRDEVDRHGFDAGRGHFVQHYGSVEVDASLLLLAQVGFCAYDDPRMLGTVAEIERTLMRDGLVRRYRTETDVDGLAGGEHPFLACSFWLVEQYANSGRKQDAAALMDRLCGLANDVGMLSEEYDVESARHAGNTPQALTHLALVRAADALVGHHGRAALRR
ncbi:glycoside hydrolase family 15 protein [Microbacterium kyungheense]|uniref:GH15 family glucan-1,4-alpha-glucosidase n=1 Tax=Microbacterium kyungheense TaxID=1263636 RepID=A0A543EQI7_9MICO|nr:glycoside hydrolase family 15 protein [Microbacterium kyungheense]TQM18513.1 GH15 family glucan-1,4-alpha-glucosidase [Microbacterium kyungheense]TQM18528.1 GH15 family glucan-1,4-alpha-glucosidase [Microbacterium kyungheense]TQM23851.1 GH15 family glucan-1,4-alpha-glucosidase [Microbacterium kyungheense]